MESQHIQELEIVTSAKLGARLIFSGVSTMKVPSILVMFYGSFFLLMRPSCSHLKLLASAGLGFELTETLDGSLEQTVY
ncbi:hypothetical protein [Bilophila wadsworthia]|uniref:hypothetical protein n=1 Tax=Bilophila wadsworthia TaxID=35833 RepID=UPI0035228B99